MVNRILSKQHGLTYLRRTTDNFIADDPTLITLTPVVRLSDGCGGYTLTPGAPRDPQEFKLIAVPANIDGIMQTDGATSRNWNYVLLGRYDCEAEIGDTWNDGKNFYRITALMHENDYERRFAAISFGSEPNYG